MRGKRIVVFNFGTSNAGKSHFLKILESLCKILNKKGICSFSIDGENPEKTRDRHTTEIATIEHLLAQPDLRPTLSPTDTTLVKTFEINNPEKDIYQERFYCKYIVKQFKRGIQFVICDLLLDDQETQNFLRDFLHQYDIDAFFPLIYCSPDEYPVRIKRRNKHALRRSRTPEYNDKFRNLDNDIRPLGAAFDQFGMLYSPISAVSTCPLIKPTARHLKKTRHRSLTPTPIVDHLRLDSFRLLCQQHLSSPRREEVIARFSPEPLMPSSPTPEEIAITAEATPDKVIKSKMGQTMLLVKQLYELIVTLEIQSYVECDPSVAVIICEYASPEIKESLVSPEQQRALEKLIIMTDAQAYLGCEESIALTIYEYYQDTPAFTLKPTIKTLCEKPKTGHKTELLDS